MTSSMIREQFDQDSLYKEIIESSLGVFWKINASTGKLVYVSPAFEKFWGISREYLYAHLNAWIDVVILEERDKVKKAYSDFLKNKSEFSLEYTIQRPDGEKCTILDRGLKIKDEQGNDTYAIGLAIDITKLKNTQAQTSNRRASVENDSLPETSKPALYYKETHSSPGYNRSSFTGFLSRTQLIQILKQIINASRQGQYRTALLFLDIDHFKKINVQYGHEFGDELLRLAGERLSTKVRVNDIVARLGGDRFVVILPHIEKTEMVDIVAKKLLEIFSEPFKINNQESSITMSIGISIFPNDGEEIQTLMGKADIAMYQVKETGGNNFQYATKEMSNAIQKRSELELALQKAIQNEEFVLYYQPKIDIKDNKIIGLEAFLHWKHQSRILDPDEFIPFSEETGLIVPIGEWVIRTACKELKAWHTFNPELSISVNLSSKQIMEGNLVTCIQNITKELEISPSFLELEITESKLLFSLEKSTALMQALKNMNVQVAIDDFGTGYSSLSYLKRFNIDAVKIDRSLVKELPEDLHNAELSKAIIAMAHSLGLKVIAEGVETKEQYHFLLDADCDQMQGYYFCRPMPLPAITEILKKPVQLL